MGLFTQVAQSVKSNYLLMGTVKDRLSVTMEVMTFTPNRTGEQGQKVVSLLLNSLWRHS